MNKEVLDRIVTAAKDVILECGEYPTTTFVEWDHTNFMALGLMGDAESTYERAQMKFHAGRVFAQKFLLGKKKFKKSRVTSVCEVDEVWFTMWAGDTPPKSRPRNDPARREALAVAVLDAETMLQTMKKYEIIRDGAGTLIDLLELEEGEAHGPHLPCFLAGARTASQDISQAIHAFRHTFEKYALSIPR